jgi:hypothetical protein
METKPEKKIYRHADNPEEKRFYDAALDMGTRHWSAVTLPLNDRGTAPSRSLDEDEEQLVINTIQWLGSPVGQGFLRDMGYEKKIEPEKVSYKVMTDKDRRYVVRRAKKNIVGRWKFATESKKDAYVEDECRKLGYTLAEFYATDGKFLNKILDR